MSINLRLIFYAGGVVGPAQPEAKAAFVRVAQGRDLPGAVVAAQRDHPRQQRHRSQVCSLVQTLMIYSVCLESFLLNVFNVKAPVHSNGLQW